MEPSTLKRTLAANAAFSGITGTLMVGAAAPLSEWLGIPAWLSAALGVGLVAFAGAVFHVSRHPAPRRVVSVIAADITWIVGAAFVIVGFPEALSTAGVWTLALVTLAVADFAVFQAIGLRQLR